MMNPKKLETLLERWGEVMVPVEEVPEPVEFHAHDTELFENYVIHELADGEMTISYDRMGSPYKHYAELADYGLE